VFNSVVLYDNNTCKIVGEGFIFSVQEGHVYTWTINASTSGIFCQGFSTICPYWLDIGPLVVELTLFEATVYNGYVDINWITSSETNSHYFTLYRSDGFTDFKPIDKIDAAGYSNSIKEYNYRDNSPLEGNIYYKLVETDLNGIKHEYNIINVYNPYRLEFQVYDQFGRPTDLNTRGFKIIRYENGSVNCKFIINN
jgi:hypothetical protein